MNEQHLQNIVVKLENEILGFVDDQYHGTEGHLKMLIGNTIKDRYAQYAQFINIAEVNKVDLFLPKYQRIEKFMEDEFNINYIRKKDDLREMR